eukprot:2600296-Amphidinium_carterae.1
MLCSRTCEVPPIATQKEKQRAWQYQRCQVYYSCFFRSPFFQVGDLKGLMREIAGGLRGQICAVPVSKKMSLMCKGSGLTMGHN